MRASSMSSRSARWLPPMISPMPGASTSIAATVLPSSFNDDGRTVAAMDVLAPGSGEIIGGSQRAERLDMLDARMAQFGLDAAHYGWYRDFRRYGTVPHAGFGLAFERLVVYVGGLGKIRDAIPSPRAPGSAEF